MPKGKKMNNMKKTYMIGLVALMMVSMCSTAAAAAADDDVVYEEYDYCVGINAISTDGDDVPEEIPGTGPDGQESPNNQETEHETERLRPVYDRQENSNMG